MSSALEVRGADNLARTAAHAADELRNMAATNARVAAGILAAARPPVRTGRLRASGSTASSATEAVVSWPVRYAVFVERRRGFAAAALEGRRTATLEHYSSAINAAIGKIRGV